MTAAAPAVPASLTGQAALFDEMGDLKRIRVAHADGSVAARAFARAWAALVDGADPARVALGECAAAAAGVRLSGVDAEVLSLAGCAADDIGAVLRDAVVDVTASQPRAVTDALVGALPHPVVGHGPPPAFVPALTRQPRAGATGAGRRRRLVEPPENHAEHCWAVAVYGAMLALGDGRSGPEVGRTFVLGLAHHLHNAVLPDAGLVGELALGPLLDPLTARLTEREIGTLPDGLATVVREAFDVGRTADTPVGWAFHAADVLDRVLQMHHHARVAAFTVEAATEDLDLVHDGPVADHHRAVLAAAGLLR